MLMYRILAEKLRVVRRGGGRSFSCNGGDNHRKGDKTERKEKREGRREGWRERKRETEREKIR